MGGAGSKRLQRSDSAVSRLLFSAIERSASFCHIVLAAKENKPAYCGPMFLEVFVLGAAINLDRRIFWRIES